MSWKNRFLDLLYTGIFLAGFGSFLHFVVKNLVLEQHDAFDAEKHDPAKWSCVLKSDLANRSGSPSIREAYRGAAGHLHWKDEREKKCWPASP
jgi:hypothetical protein